MSLLAVSVSLLLFAAGPVLSLPIPPKLVAIKTQELSIVQGDAKSQEIPLMLEYYDDGLISPSQCEDYCTFTYPTHTYPVVEHHLACRQGCILLQLGALPSSCKLECTNMYTTEGEQYACGVGCNRPTPQSLDPQGDQVLRTLMAVSSVKTTSVGFPLFSLKETLKHCLWGNGKEVANDNFHWEEPKHYKLGNGQELFFLSGHSSSPEGELSVKDLFPPDLPHSLLKDKTFSHPSLVYVSKSILRTVYHRTFVNKLLFSLGIVLLVVGGPLLVLSIIADSMSTDKKGKADREDKISFNIKSPHCDHCPHVLTQQTEMLSKNSPKDMPILSPVTVILDSKQ